MSPTLRRVVTFALIVAVVLGLELGFDRLVPDAAWRQLALFAMVNVMVALSLNVINGMAGQFSIGHAGFVGIGAYTAAVVASQLKSSGGLNTSFTHSLVAVPLSVGAGATVAALFGLIVGLPSLRLRGDYLAIVTLGFAEIFRLIIASARQDATTGVSGLIASLGGQNGY